MLLLRKMRLFPVIVVARIVHALRLPQIAYPRVFLGIAFMVILLTIVSLMPDQTQRKPYLVIQPQQLRTAQYAIPVLPDHEIVPVPVTGR